VSSEDDGTKWVYGTGGAVIGGIVGYFLASHELADEDRPPILVQGGSLVFTSGGGEGCGGTQQKKAKNNAKPWKKKQGEDRWQPKHQNGRPTKWFIVEVESGDPACPSILVAETIEITYEGRSFTLASSPEFNASGKKVPTLAGPGLAPDGHPDSPVLVHDKGGHGTISKVKFTAKDTIISCEFVTQMCIWQF
jgi:hypothetical protein